MAGKLTVESVYFLFGRTINTFMWCLMGRPWRRFLWSLLGMTMKTFCWVGHWAEPWRLFVDDVHWAGPWKLFVVVLASAARSNSLYCRNYFGLMWESWHLRRGPIRCAAEIISGLCWMPGICGEALFVLLPKLNRAYVESLVSATRIYLFYCRNYIGLALKTWYQRLGFICFTAEIISGLRGRPGICGEVQLAKWNSEWATSDDIRIL